MTGTPILSSSPLSVVSVLMVGFADGSFEESVLVDCLIKDDCSVTDD